MLPLGSMKARKKYFEEKKANISWKEINENLVDKIWGENQPVWPEDPVFIHEEKFSGRSVEKNISEIMAKVEEKKGEAIVITPLDEIAWLTNLRGKDIDYNPLFFSYAIIHKEEEKHTISLYINLKKVAHIGEYLAEKNIKCYPYDQIFSDVSKDGKFKDTKFVIDEGGMNTRLYNSMVQENLINVEDLVGEIKMIKNEV